MNDSYQYSSLEAKLFEFTMTIISFPTQVATLHNNIASFESSNAIISIPTPTNVLPSFKTILILNQYCSIIFVSRNVFWINSIFDRCLLTRARITQNDFDILWRRKHHWFRFNVEKGKFLFCHRQKINNRFVSILQSYFFGSESLRK